MSISHTKRTQSRAVVLATIILATAAAPSTSRAQDDEPSLNDLYEQANRRVQRGQFSRAMMAYQQIVARDPMWSDVWYNMGEVGRVSENREGCILYFSRYLFIEENALDGDEVRTIITDCASGLVSSGSLSVSAQPGSANIAVDGVIIARGQLQGFVTSTGPHEIEVSLEHYVSYTESATVDPEVEARVTATLEGISYYGTVSIAANLEGAEVFVDDSSAGVTPLSEPIRLQVGEYLIRVSKTGYYDWVRRLEVFRDEEHSLEVELHVVEPETERDRRY